MFTLSACGGWFEGSAPDRIRAACKYGFKAVEMLDWQSFDLPETRKALDETGVRLSSILAGSRDKVKHEITRNEHGLVWEDTGDVLVEALKETLEVAKFLDITKIIVTSGNERPGLSREEHKKILVENLRRGAEVVKGTGVELVLEPLNVLVDHAGYFLVTTDESLEVLDRVGCPNEVKLLFDIYHQQISEGNVIRNLLRAMPVIGHIHVADNPGRKEPGTGELNYKNIFRAIDKAGYGEFVVFECGRSEPVETLCPKMLALAEE